MEDKNEEIHEEQKEENQDEKKAKEKQNNKCYDFYFREFISDIFFEKKVRDIMLTNTFSKTNKTTNNIKKKLDAEYRFFHEFEFKFGKLLKLNVNNVDEDGLELFYLKFVLPIFIDKQNHFSIELKNLFEKFFKKKEDFYKEESVIKDNIKRLYRHELKIQNKNSDNDSVKLKMIEDINLVIKEVSIKLIKYIISSTYPYFLNLKIIQDNFKVKYQSNVLA